MAQLSQMRVAPVAGIRPGVRNFRLDVCLQLHVLDVNSERDLATAFAGARDCPPHLSRDVLTKMAGGCRRPAIGGPVDVLEQQQSDHEPALDPRPALRAVERRDLAIDPVPVILAPSCTSSCFRLMIWSSLARNRSPSPVVSGFFGRIVPLRCDHGITAADSKESRKRNRKLPRLSTPKACNLKTASSEI